MRISIKSKNFDCGASLRSHIEKEINELVTKYFEQADEANINLGKDSKNFTVSIQLHIGKRILLQSQGQASDAYIAFGDAASHIAKRLRRLKRRIKDNMRHKASATVEENRITTDIIRHGIVDKEKEIGFTAVVAETETNIDKIPLQEAVDRFEASANPVLLFKRRSDNRLNMLYRRPDGAIGWVDPRAIS